MGTFPHPLWFVPPFLLYDTTQHDAPMLQRRGLSKGGWWSLWPAGDRWHRCPPALGARSLLPPPRCLQEVAEGRGGAGVPEEAGGHRRHRGEGGEEGGEEGGQAGGEAGGEEGAGAEEGGEPDEAVGESRACVCVCVNGLH